MNKSFVTNVSAALIFLGGYIFPIYSDHLFSVGIFALSGGLTNWLAVHMLFEKIPFLFGSGVIPNRFEEFKTGIRTLIVSEFFTRENIERFFSANGEDVTKEVLDKVDFDRVFSGLTDAIADSQMGSMLAMVGGKKALEPLRGPISEKLKEIISDLVNNNGADQSKGDFAQSLINQVEQVIDKRLNELTPEHVKGILQEMIRKHLGWLVVWGGVFGGIIGLSVSLFHQI
tara:strand:- start:5732 stop:6418 length:687 start_codon:yes stop_codon:yes gene_type:complete